MVKALLDLRQLLCHHNLDTKLAVVASTFSIFFNFNMISMFIYFNFQQRIKPRKAKDSTVKKKELLSMILM